MPVPFSVNPGAQNNQKPTYHRFTVDYNIKKTVQLYVGQVVMLTYTFTSTNGYVPIQTTMASNASYTSTYKNIPPASAQDGTYTPISVQLATTASYTIIGVVAGGSYSGTTSLKLLKPTTNATGYLATVVISGLVTIRIKASVTPNKSIIVSSTAGFATKATTPTAGKTLGTWLQKKTYSSGTTTYAFGLVRPV